MLWWLKIILWEILALIFHFVLFFFSYFFSSPLSFSSSLSLKFNERLVASFSWRLDINIMLFWELLIHCMRPCFRTSKRIQWKCSKQYLHTIFLPLFFASFSSIFSQSLSSYNSVLLILQLPSLRLPPYILLYQQFLSSLYRIFSLILFYLLPESIYL